MFNIYALFYEKDDKVQTLDGHIATNNYEHPNMVALAIIDQADAVETEEWKRFELPFDYERFGKTIDLEKLAKGQYNIKYYPVRQQKRRRIQRCSRQHITY